MEAAILEAIKEWFWAPLCAFFLSAIGWHIKADREARHQLEKDVREIYEKIDEKSTHVENNFVRKDALHSLTKQVHIIAEDIKWMARQQGKKDNE